MPKTNKFTIVMLLVAIIAVAFGAGYTFGKTTTVSSEAGLDVIGQAWDIILTDYVDRDNLDTEALKQGAIEGMLATLDDPYASYLEAESMEIGLSDLEGEFDGIGAYVGVNEDGHLTIIAPIAGSPAEQAGILAGDIILAIDGEPTNNLSIAEAIVKIRGPRGTAVSLLVLHRDETEPVEIEIIRTTVELPSVNFEMKGDIAYINITQFSERTDTELIPVLESLAGAKATGIILDLRGNPGGLLDIVVEVISHFVRDGTVVQVRDNQGNITVLEVNKSAVFTDLPMVVLVDDSSASASEILAGALQDYGRAPIAGTTTYGKGSVNVLLQLSDGSGIYITTARWLTPNGRLIEGQGIEPDYTLEVTGDDAINWAIGYLTGSQ